MRKLLFMITALAFMFIACEKDTQEVNTDNPEIAVQFKIDQTNLDLKSGVPECDDEVIWHDVQYSIEDADGNVTWYTTEIYYLDSENLTQSIKLAPGDYKLTSFVVRDGQGNVIRAAPKSTSIYYDLMTYKLDLAFTVESFYKKQVAIDVLCYEHLAYDDFGFSWFEFNDVRIERQCWFGDICAQNLEDFDGTIYENTVGGVQYDMPALFKVSIHKVVIEDGFETLVFIQEFQNYEPLYEGDCLEVYWPNRLLEEEKFVFNLEVWTPNGLENVASWIVMDGNGPNTNTPDFPEDDGVVDFVVGNCNTSPVDYQFPAYIIN